MTMSYNDQLIAYHLEIAKKRAEARSVGMEVADIQKSDLNLVPGLGKSSIEKLRSSGITSVELLAKADEDTLKRVLNPISRKQVKEYLASIANK